MIYVHAFQLDWKPEHNNGGSELKPRKFISSLAAVILHSIATANLLAAFRLCTAVYLRLATTNLVQLL